jgi:glycosyltransferase involved in cell wall biosynthesis
MHRLKWADLPSPLPDQTGWMWHAECCQLPKTTLANHFLPRITVVTPSFNQGRFIETTIRSVLLQGYPNLEYIIIDGGSSDDSVEIIQKYEPWLAYWVSEKDRGQAHAINKGFARATGDLYAYLNSDDFYEPGALHRCVPAFEGGHQWIVGRVRCWLEGVGEWPFPELPGNSFARWFLSCPIPQAGCFWSAKLHREMGPFREDLNFIIDYEYWLRFRFIKRIKPFYIDQPIACYRLHADSKTVARNTEFIREGQPILQQYKRRLNWLQRGWLWGVRRHRMARVRGTKAVALMKTGKVREALHHLISALAAWPFLIIDFSGMILAFQELTNNRSDQPNMPQVWPVWDE